MKENMACSFFLEGYNCCQAVVLAFAEEMGMEKDALLRLSSSLGGGMGGLGEVCGAVSGMFLVLGALYGYSSPSDTAAKQLHYARIRALCKAFTEKYGSILCRELKSAADTRKTCAELVRYAAHLTEEYCRDNPPSQNKK